MSFRLTLLSIALLFSAPTQRDRFIIPNVDVFDGYRIVRNRTITVERGMITSIDAAAGKPSGLTLLPGLIDAHCHISGESALAQAAALGVTTALDMWGDPHELMPLLQGIERGEHPNAADLRTSGWGVTVAGGHPSELGVSMPVLGPKSNVQQFVDARFAEGSNYLKIMYEHSLPTLTLEQLNALVIAAHRRGKIAVAHEGVQAEGLAEMEAGVDGIEHIFADSPISREFLQIATASRMVFTPTLTVISAACGRPTGAALAKDDRFRPYLPIWQVRMLNATFPATAIAKNHWKFACEAVHVLHAAGLTILAGTDAPNPSTGYGVSVHEELRLLTECGLTNLEALRAATSGPAREFGLLDRGRIQPGRRADLLLVQGDPAADIRATRDIVRVWRSGTPIDRSRKLK